MFITNVNIPSAPQQFFCTVIIVRLNRFDQPTILKEVDFSANRQAKRTHNGKEAKQAEKLSY